MKKIIIMMLFWSLFIPVDLFAFGAIAIDDNTTDSDPAYGFSIGADTKREAKRTAMEYCEEYGGENCRVVVWFETCGAVAVSRKYYGYGYGSSKRRAIADAMEMCGSRHCRLVTAECE
ncbi:MAG: DUF4189 domain-containing protein [Magnetococcales bacterium]|nr:DUF4189 domain-containing protein [Magnetococcales bacterium]MBF0150937.1 DUF4189 domain-containing protein [Magnetococcales bacterium]MBF0174190.1 DUF4189 domain-containing protein [Magnetococcales bacterium]MBF0631972.1 DUF4189 domain-containing protein [Magnetococcales bacterium]